MSRETCPVSAAVLSGMTLQKSIHVRAASDGSPAVGDYPTVRPRQNVASSERRVGILTEAPQLWYLRARGS